MTPNQDTIDQHKVFNCIYVLHSLLFVIHRVPPCQGISGALATVRTFPSLRTGPFLVSFTSAACVGILLQVGGR